MIYTDSCLSKCECEIEKEFGIKIIKRIDSTLWNINDAMRIITIPEVSLAVINQLDEISIMEISLLNFMCKPILVTTRLISEYPVISRTVDFIDSSCNLLLSDNNFIRWFRSWRI